MLPDRVFRSDCYPSHAVRINSYSKPKYLLEVLKVIDGMPELATLLASPLGALFSLPVRQCSLSGQLVHQMLCRQLHTTNSEELWFVFAGQPLRFSLTEFHEVTGLDCSPLPAERDLAAATTHAEGSAPYWYSLIGGTLGSVTVKELLRRLKSEPAMPSWRKFRLALVVIVDGILLTRTHPVKASPEVVEMVKDIDFFLSYPWGRHSFHRMLRMVKVGPYIEDTSSLVGKLKQSSLAVHGFPLSIQLFAFKIILAFLSLLRNGDEKYTFLHQRIPCLLKCTTYHTSNILSLEKKIDVRFPPYLFLLSFIFLRIPAANLFSPQLQVIHSQPRPTSSLESGYCDPKVHFLESLLASSYQLTEKDWPGGDSSLPSLQSSRKRTSPSLNSGSSSSGVHNLRTNSKRYTNGSSVNNPRDADTRLDRRLKSFKASILDEVRHLITQNTLVVDASIKPLQPDASQRTSVIPSRRTRSGCAGVSADSFSTRSSANPSFSPPYAKQSPLSDPAIDSHHTVISPVTGVYSPVDPFKSGGSGFPLGNTDVSPPDVMQFFLPFYT